MAEAVYILCFLTSTACAVLLLRGYRKNKTRFLLWCAICFCSLAVNNLVLYVDMVMLPAVDLSLYREIIGLLGMSILVYGLVWDIG